MGSNALEWISGSGGPLMLLAREHIESWSGIDPPLDGRVIRTKARWDPEHPATDYDRACECEEPIEILDVGEGHGLILAGEPHPTAVLIRPEGALLLRWVESETESAILALASRLSIEPVAPGARTIEAYPGPLVLFDAACPGPELEDDGIELDLLPGRYAASASSHEVDGVSLVVVGLRRVA